MTSVRVKGADKLDRLARRLRDAGDGGLKNEALREIRETTKPTIRKVREGILAGSLPRRGGLAEEVAGANIATRTNLRADRIKVQIVATEGHRDLKSMNRGRLRHPVFGNRSAWVTQRIRPDWFDRPIKEDRPRMLAGVKRALETVARKIGRPL